MVWGGGALKYILKRCMRYLLRTLKEHIFKGQENDPKTGFGMIFIKKHQLGLKLTNEMIGEAQMFLKTVYNFYLRNIYQTLIILFMCFLLIIASPGSGIVVALWLKLLCCSAIESQLLAAGGLMPKGFKVNCMPHWGVRIRCTSCAHKPCNAGAVELVS